MKTSFVNSDREKNAMCFMLFAYFGSEMEGDKLIKNCARRAYLDFNRTLRFNEIEEIYRYVFVEKLCEFIESKIDYLLDSQNQDVFDDRHNEICIALQKLAQTAKASIGNEKILNVIKQNELEKNRENESFYYGQSQKWLNMTLKYMWITGAMKTKGNIEKFLHIPVDSYIIEAVHKVNTVKLPKKEKGGYGIEKFVSWSKWTKSDYCSFQMSLRPLYKNEGKLPLEWENQKWMEIFQKRYDAEKKKLQKRANGKAVAFEK